MIFHPTARPSQFSLAILLAISSFSALAAEDATLSEVQVTAPKLLVPTRQAHETVYTGTAVTAEGIERQGRQAETSVYSAIDMLPGVNTESPDSSGLAVEQSSVRVRGVSSLLGALSVEGVPNYGGNPLGARDYVYDMQNFTDVSVYKGATPGDIGSGMGSRGGVIVLRPRWPGEKFAAGISQSFGSDNHLRTYARLESGILGSAGTRIGAAASWSKGDKWRGSGDLGPRTNANLMLVQPLGENLDFKLWYNHNEQKQHLYRPLTYAQIQSLDNNYKLDYNTALTGVAARDWLYYDYNRGDYRNDDMMAILTWRASPSTTITLKPYYAKEDTQIYQGTAMAGGLVQLRDRDITRKGVIAEVAAEWQGIKGVFGYHYEVTDMDITSKNYAPTPGGLSYRGYGVYSTTATTYNNAPYFKLSGQSGKLGWQVGLKHYTFEDAGSASYTSGPPPLYPLVRATDLDRKIKTQKVWLPTVGLAYDLTAQTQLQASAGRNFIRPYAYMPLSNIYRNNRPAFQAAGVTLQNLFDGYKIETTNTIDFGLRHQAEHFDVTPTLFYSKHKNLLTTISDSRVFVGGSPVNYQQNVGKATSYGMELAFNAYVNDRLSFFVNPTYTHFVYDDDIVNRGTRIASKGKQVLDTPRWMARAGLNWRLGDFEIAPSLRYLGERYGNVAHTERVGSHVLADLAIRYTRKKVLGNATLKAGLELNNLFNRKYVAVIDAFDDNLGGAASYRVGAPFSAAFKLGLEW